MIDYKLHIQGAKKKIISRLNLFLWNSNTYLLINVVPFKIVSLELQTVDRMVMSLSEAFHEIMMPTV